MFFGDGERGVDGGGDDDDDEAEEKETVEVEVVVGMGVWEGKMRSVWWSGGGIIIEVEADEDFRRACCLRICRNTDTITRSNIGGQCLSCSIDHVEIITYRSEYK